MIHNICWGVILLRRPFSAAGAPAQGRSCQQAGVLPSVFLVNRLKVHEKPQVEMGWGKDYAMPMIVCKRITAYAYVCPGGIAATCPLR